MQESLKTRASWERVEYVLLSGFLIHSLNQPVVRSLQPVTPALQANVMAFTWLYLQGNITKGQRNIGEHLGCNQRAAGRL